MSKKSRTGFIRNISIKGGLIVYDVQDANIPDRTYPNVVFQDQSVEQVAPIPVDSKVNIQKNFDEQWVIKGVLTTTPSHSGSPDGMEQGAKEGFGSYGLFFGPRNENEEIESFFIEYGEDGYDLEATVDGKVTITKRYGDEKETTIVLSKDESTLKRIKGENVQTSVSLTDDKAEVKKMSEGEMETSLALDSNSLTMKDKDGNGIQLDGTDKLHLVGNKVEFHTDGTKSL